MSNDSTAQNDGSLTIGINADASGMTDVFAQCAEKLANFEKMYADFAKEIKRIEEDTVARENEQKRLAQVAAAEKELATVRERERREGMTDTQRKLEAAEKEIARKRELLDVLLKEMELKRQAGPLTEEDSRRLDELTAQYAGLNAELDKRRDAIVDAAMDKLAAEDAAAERKLLDDITAAEEKLAALRERQAVAGMSAQEKKLHAVAQEVEAEKAVIAAVMEKLQKKAEDSSLTEEEIRRLDELTAQYNAVNDSLAERQAKIKSDDAEAAERKLLDDITAAEEKLAALRERQAVAGMTQQEKQVYAIQREIDAEKAVIQAVLEGLEAKRQSVGITEEELHRMEELLSAREALNARDPAQENAAAEAEKKLTAAQKERTAEVEAAEKRLDAMRREMHMESLSELDREIFAVQEQFNERAKTLDLLLEELELKAASNELDDEGLANLKQLRKERAALNAELEKRVARIRDADAEKRAKEALKEAQEMEKEAEARRQQAAGRYKDFAVALAATTYNIQTYVVGPIKGMLAGYSQVGREMDKLTRQSRLEVAQLTALGFAAEQSGANISDVASAMGNLNGAMDRARRGDMGARQDIFKGSGLFYEDLERMPVEERMMAVADVISKVANQADRAEIARRMFGSGGEALLPMLEKGREGIKDLVAEADKLGVPLSKEDVANSKQLANELNRLRGITTGLRDTFLSTMAGPITDFLSRGKEMLLTVRGFITANPRLVQTLGMVTAGVVALVTAVTVGVPVVSVIMSAFGTLLGLMKAGAIAVTALATPWLAIPAAIAGAVYALVRFTDVGKTAFGSVKGWAAGALAGISNFFGDAVKLIMQGDFSAAFQNIWLRCEKIFIQGVAAIQNQFQSVFEIAKGIFGPLWEYVTGIFYSLWDTVKTATASAINWISETWKKLYASAAGIFGKMFGELTEGFWALGDEIGAEQDNIGDVLVTAWYGIQKSLLNIWYTLRQKWMELTTFMRKTWSDYNTWWGKQWNKALGKIYGLSDDEIKQMNSAMDAVNRSDKRGMDADRDRNLANNEAERDAALDGLRRDTADRLNDAKGKRNQRTMDTDARVAQIDEVLAAQRAKLDVNVATPAERRAENVMVGAGGDVPAFLREMQKLSTMSTTSAYQALAGSGDTTADKQLEVTRQLRTLVDTILAAIKDGKF